MRKAWIIGGLGLVGVLLMGGGLALLSVPLALVTVGSLCLAGAALGYYTSIRAVPAVSAGPAPAAPPAEALPEPGPAQEAAPPGSVHEPEQGGLTPQTPAPSDDEATAVGTGPEAVEDPQAAETVHEPAVPATEQESPEVPVERGPTETRPAPKLRAVTATAATYQDGGMTATRQLRIRLGGRRRT